MVTYAKRPEQSDRLAHPPQKRQSKATVPSIEPISAGDVVMETTFSPSGAMVPAMRLKRAEQSSGSGGKSSERHAVINSSVVSALESSSIAITPMSDGGHSAAHAPSQSSSADSCIMNIHSSRLNTFNPWAKTEDRYSARVCTAIILTLIVLTMSAIYFAIYVASHLPTDQVGGS